MNKGHQILSSKPFQIEAWSFPNHGDEDRFNSDIYKQSGFTSLGVTHSVAELNEYPIDVQDILWSKIEEVHHGMNNFEFGKSANLVRLQFEDDNVHPDNLVIVEQAKAWFIARRNDARLTNIPLTLDLPFVGWDDVSFDKLDAMLGILKPDMIFFNYFPWEYSATNKAIDFYYNWLGRNFFYRRLALKHDIPFGTFPQTWFAHRATPPSYSQMMFNNFSALAFGNKMLSAFVYNSYPSTDPNYPIRSFLFTPDFKPTPEFEYQKEINRQVKILGNVLVKLNTVDVRFIPKVGGKQIVPYEWINGTRPDNYLTNVSSNSDVVVGYFKPLEGIDDNYIMIVNGKYNEYGTEDVTEEIIKLWFDFGDNPNINSIEKISRETGLIETISLIKTDGNKYYCYMELLGGEGDLFKYKNGLTFSTFEPEPNLSTKDFINNIEVVEPKIVKPKSNIFKRFWKWFTYFFFGCDNEPVLISYKPVEVEADSLTDQINAERINRGLNILISEKLLTEIAEHKATSMYLNSEVNHNGIIERQEETMTDINGEIVVKVSPEYMFEVYMNSPNHKKRIIDSAFTHVGSFTIEKYNCVMFAKY